MSPYRGGPPKRDDEPPPDFRAPSSSARDELFHWAMLGAGLATTTWIAIPLASIALLTGGLGAGTIAYFTHARRRARREASRRK